METLIEEDWMGYLSLGRRLEGGEVGVREAEKRIRGVEREVQVPPRPSVEGSGSFERLGVWVRIANCRRLRNALRSGSENSMPRCPKSCEYERTP
jgi:hypothetical protein